MTAKHRDALVEHLLPYQASGERAALEDFEEVCEIILWAMKRQDKQVGFSYKHLGQIEYMARPAYKRTLERELAAIGVLDFKVAMLMDGTVDDTAWVYW